MILIVCVCVFFPSFILDVPAGFTQEEGRTGFLIHLVSAVRALIFLARRIQPFLSLVDGEVEFCVLRPSFMGIVSFPRLPTKAMTGHVGAAWGGSFWRV